MEAFGNRVLVSPLTPTGMYMSLTIDGQSELEVKKGVVTSVSSNLTNPDIDVDIEVGDTINYVGAIASLDGLDVVNFSDIITIEHSPQHAQRIQEEMEMMFGNSDSDEYEDDEEPTCGCDCVCCEEPCEEPCENKTESNVEG